MVARPAAQGHHGGRVMMENIVVHGGSITFTHRLPDGERFAPDAWAGNIGKLVPVKVGNKRLEGIVRHAIVADDGLSVVITIEVG